MKHELPEGYEWEPTVMCGAYRRCHWGRIVQPDNFIVCVLSCSPGTAGRHLHIEWNANPELGDSVSIVAFLAEVAEQHEQKPESEQAPRSCAGVFVGDDGEREYRNSIAIEFARVAFGWFGANINEPQSAQFAKYVFSRADAFVARSRQPMQEAEHE